MCTSTSCLARHREHSWRKFSDKLHWTGRYRSRHCTKIRCYQWHNRRGRPPRMALPAGRMLKPNATASWLVILPGSEFPRSVGEFFWGCLSLRFFCFLRLLIRRRFRGMFSSLLLLPPPLSLFFLKKKKKCAKDFWPLNPIQLV